MPYVTSPRTIYSSGGYYDYPACRITESSTTIQNVGVTSDERPPTTQKAARDDSGWRDPTGYYRRIHSGWNYGSLQWEAYLRGKLRYMTPPFCVERVHQFSGVAPSGISFSCPDPYQDGNVLNECLAKLRNRGVDLAVAFAERRQTIDLVRGSAWKFYNAFRQLRRGDVMGAAREFGISNHRGGRIETKSFAQNWLELQYGWKPLIYDVGDAVKMLSTNDLNRPDRYSARVVRKIKKWKDNTGEVTLQSSDLRQTCSYKTTLEELHHVRLDYFLNSSGLATLNQLGFIDPATVLWEVTPFSFVVDWFLPIGNYLSALSATTGWLFRGGSYTTKMTMQKVTLTPGAISCINGNVIPETMSGYITFPGARIMKMARAPYYTAPSAALPSIVDDPLNPNRMLNLLSLLKQAKTMV